MTDEVQLLGNCVTCKVAVNNFATHWRCSNPKCPAIMCEDCTLNEERHAHPMNKVKGEKRGIALTITHYPSQSLCILNLLTRRNPVTFFSYQSALVLCRVRCMLLLSHSSSFSTLQAKNIKSVLSVMDFDGAIDGVKELREVYYKKGKPYRQTAICKVGKFGLPKLSL